MNVLFGMILGAIGLGFVGVAFALIMGDMLAPIIRFGEQHPLIAFIIAMLLVIIGSWIYDNGAGIAGVAR